MTTPTGAGEARMTLEVDGHVYHSRALAIGPQTAAERLAKALPSLSRLMSMNLSRCIAEEKRKTAGEKPAA